MERGMNQPDPAKSPRLRRGNALLIVLGSVVLLSAILLSFLTSASTDLIVSKSYQQTVQAKGLADTAVNLVVGQIRKATSDPAKAWISQPGLIRTFAAGATSADGYYKLYSAADMMPSAFDPAAALGTEISADWFNVPGQYADLNEPVRNASGDARHPILPDPNNLRDAGGNAVVLPGFGMDAVAANNSANSPANPVPMPVRWLYVLEDGTLAPAGNPSGSDYPLANPQGKKITGRIAFWTDDETSKININTAVGDEWNASPNAVDGSYWDTPRTLSSIDKRLAGYQPRAAEYQRYPGHPATTYLSAAFPPGLTRAELLQIVPRAEAGGSQGGTISNYNSGTLDPNPISLDKERLYASVDELLYRPGSSSGNRADNPLSEEDLENAKFLITAHSRAPELTLFNKPRITIWPVPDNPDDRSLYDKLIAFASTIGGKKYYFTRKDPDSTTEDYSGIARNKELFDEVLVEDYAEAVPPGFTESLKDKYPHTEALLTRIFDYIRSTNLADQYSGAEPYTKVPTTTYLNNPGSGQVVPITINGHRGFGRFPTLSEVAVLLYSEGETTSGGNVTTTMRAILLFELFIPAMGYADCYPDFTIEAEDLNNLTISTPGTPPGPAITIFPSGTLSFNYRDGKQYPGTHERRWGGWMGPNQLLQNLSNFNEYPFVSTSSFSMTRPTGITNNRFRLNGGTIKLRIKGGSDYVQNFTLTFPAAANIKMPVRRIPWQNFASRISLGVDNWFEFIQGHHNLDGGDVVRSLEAAWYRDLRAIALKPNVPESDFIPTPYYSSDRKLTHSLRTGLGFMYAVNELDNGHSGGMVAKSSANYRHSINSQLLRSSRPNVHASSLSSTSPYWGSEGARMPASSGQGPEGDWDNGVGLVPDGPYINKADEGSIEQNAYFGFEQTPPLGSFFSANRQIPSAVMFGSLPTVNISGADTDANSRYCTLLFCPNPASGPAHPGRSAAYPDHLLLDWFTMPVVEPYAISEPFATAGKINLNYQIVPFTYLKRTTALRALLKSSRVIAIPNGSGANYKDESSLTTGGPPNTFTTQVRLPVNADETLEDFDERFAAGTNKPFVSASEICDMFLVPEGTDLSTVKSSWWNNYRMTGDNSRERPYAELYPRLTTRSNTFTVHVRAQTLQKVGVNPDHSRWIEGTDKVASEWRGSYVIERFLDPNLAGYTDGTPLDGSKYKYRVVMTRQFDAVP